MAAAAGVQVSAHRDELLPILRQIAADHVAVCDGCGFPDDIAELVLCDLTEAFERRQIPKVKEAA